MKMTITRSAVIEAPIARVWSVLRDFNGWQRWHPAVTRSRMENDLDGDVVGSVRRFTLNDGVEIREQLLSDNDRDTTFTTGILDAPLPLFNYVSTVRLKTITDGNRTFWDWRTHFQAPGGRVAELEQRIGQELCEGGFAGMRKFLAEQEAPSRVPTAASATLMPPRPAGNHVPSAAIVVTAAGGPESMSLTEISVPPPGAGQVRIRQTAVAVNTFDIMHRTGSTAEFELPGTPGVEGVGEIIDMGRQVHGLFTGERVAYLSPRPGAYCEIRCIDADACLPLPDELSDIEASTLLKGVTAGLLLGRVFTSVPGSWIVIPSVADGFGHLISQWARVLEMNVIGTVYTVEQARFSRDHGCGHPILLTDPNRLAADVMRITNGHGVDCWIHNSDGVGLDTAVSSMARCGRIAVIDSLEDQPLSVNVNDLKKRSLTLSAPVVFDYFADRPYFQRLAHHLFTMIQHKTIIPALSRFPLGQAAQAHRQTNDQKHTGGAVLIPGH
jgi:NADPH:quinone reductase-like Zn-dependent oxidoreductase